jgi:alpha-L-fucosidase
MKHTRTLLTALLLTPLAAIHAADAPKLPATPAVAATPAAAPRATVTERKLPNGDSELQLLDAQGKILETAVVNLSRHHQPATAPDDPLITKWRSWKYGAFLCYNSNQSSGSEHCTIRDARQYAPADLDIRQWAQTLKAAGMKYAVLTTSHTSGFLLWDSPTSEFDVANSGNRTDVVKGFVEECRSHDIIPGLYYCMWGGPKAPKEKRVEKRADSPRAVILYQLRELATRYGTIPYFWIDMMNWAPSDLKPQEVYDLLKNISPTSVIIINQHIQDGTKLKYFPTDILNGEVTMPPATGHQATRTVGGTGYYLPFEYEPCSQWRPSQKSPGNQKYVWFTYGAGKPFEASQPYPAVKLAAEITEARRRGASNILLSCAPDHTGKFREGDVRQLTELRRLLDIENTHNNRQQP